MNPNNDADALIRSVSVRSGELRERAERVQAELATILESSQSRDGLATVIVGAGGIMRKISMSPAATRATPDELNAAIMSAYQHGCRLAAEKAAEIVQRFAPGSPAVAMMRDAIPPDLDEDEEQTR
jgi:DNA-binding protein YbaB